MSELQRTGFESGGRALSRYFQEVEGTDLLSPEQERWAAVRIVEARRSYWNALLAYPRLRRSIFKLIGKVASATLKQDLAERSFEISRMTRTSEAASQLTAELASFMATHDVSTDVADVIASDVQSLGTAHSQGNALDKRAARPDSDEFREYRRKVGAARVALNRARADFAKANLRLVLKMARNYQRVGALPLADLIQEGNIGLMVAIDRFDPSRGLRFSTYGIWWIRHQIHRALTDKGRAVRLPSHVVELRSRLTKARRKFEQENCRAPTDEELAEILDVEPDKVRRFARVLAVREQAKAPNDETGLAAQFDQADETITAADAIDGDHLQESLRDALEELPSMESQILRMRFGLEDSKRYSLRQIGEVYSLSRERIRQIQERALGKLRDALERDGFDIGGLPSESALLMC